MWHSLRREVEDAVLPRPFGWQAGEAGNPHAMREPALDGRLDEIGGEEGKRDRHISLSDAAFFPLRDALRSRCCIGDEFFEPTAAARDRCDQCCASFGTYGTSVLRRGAFGQKDLAAPGRHPLLPRHMKR